VNESISRDPRWIFQDCSANCTYFQLLNSLNESAGVIVEALNMQYNMMDMLENVMLWAYDPAVVHLSMEHLRMDFNKTMVCMNRFLGTRGLPIAMLPGLNVLDASKNSQEGHLARHVTSGKYDNSGLEQMLFQEPIWGIEFTEARHAIRKVFERQVHIWDCPTPHM